MSKELKKKNSFGLKLRALFYHLIAKRWWVFWSNFRFRKAVRENIEILEEDKARTISEIKSLVKKLYKKFTWTKDGIDQLGDAVTPPPQNYKHYLNGELKDDCDGFHSLVYHCLHNSGIECYLLSVIALNSGHCVLLMKLNNKWRVIDYTDVYNGYDTPQEAIESYNKEYVALYTKAESEVYANSLTRYNYEIGKFKLVDAEELK